ncbi:MAG: deoxyguanosinetriphosphate triphosphohydrolase, partial [Firmicutes bacterium]|nr:deoxyguanosinetriphosphate triphosphohydrolase [Bacillota bacterium]
QIVHLADRIAYINHDIDDALRSGVISFDDLPKSSVELFGHSHRNRINALVMDTIRNSDGFGEIRQSPEFRDEMNNLRRFMFERVYQSPIVKRDEDLAKVEAVIETLYNYYSADIDRLPKDLQKIAERDGVSEAAKDYVAGMTDRFALAKFDELFVPIGWK